MYHLPQRSRTITYKAISEGTGTPVGCVVCKIDDIESQVESLDLGSKSLADEIADLESDENIDDELAELNQALALKEKLEEKFGIVIRNG